MTKDSLETKVDKEDWKTWLPVYGMYQTYKDVMAHKTNIAFKETSQGIQKTSALKYWSFVAYQSASLAGTLSAVAYNLVNHV